MLDFIDINYSFVHEKIVPKLPAATMVSNLKPEASPIKTQPLSLIL